MRSVRYALSAQGRRGHLYFGEKGTFLLWFDIDDFIDFQIEGINTRLNELHEELASVTYTTIDEVAIAIHNSSLHEFARQIGIEVLVNIDNTSNPVRIDGVRTDFNSEHVGLTRAEIGKVLWHNHPGSGAVWQSDAASYVNLIGGSICRDTGDFTVFASGASLTKAQIRQVIGITDTENYRFMYDEYSEANEIWNARTAPFSPDADAVEFACP